MGTEFKKGDVAVLAGARVEVIHVLPAFDCGDGCTIGAGYRVRYCGWGGEYISVRADALRPLDGGK